MTLVKDSVDGVIVFSLQKDCIVSAAVQGLGTSHVTITQEKNIERNPQDSNIAGCTINNIKTTPGIGNSEDLTEKNITTVRKAKSRMLCTGKATLGIRN